MTEDERDYVVGRSSDGLSQADVEHIQRVLRLHELEKVKEFKLEPAGAQSEGRSDRSEIEDLELQQAGDTAVLRREIARLRSEVLHLNARLEALEGETDAPADPLLEEPDPTFYIPVR